MSIYLSLSLHPSVYVPIYLPYRQPYSSQAKANWSERSRLHQCQLCRRKHWNQTMPFWPPPSYLHSSPSDWFIFLHRRATSIGGHTLSHKVHWSPLWMTFGGWYQSTRVEPLWCSVTLRRRKRWVSSGDTSAVSSSQNKLFLCMWSSSQWLMNTSSMAKSSHTLVYVPRNLRICAISRLRCAFSESRDCVPISRLRTIVAQSRDRATIVRNLEIAQLQHAILDCVKIAHETAIV